MVYLPISWTNADNLRNSSAEAWRVWEGGTIVEGTEDSDLDEDTSDLWKLDDRGGNNRWKIFLVPSLITVRLDFLGSGEDIIDGNVDEVGGQMYRVCFPLLPTTKQRTGVTRTWDMERKKIYI